MESGAHDNVHNKTEILHQLKSNKISFLNSFFDFRQILVKFCTEHDSHTAGLCAKLQKDSSMKMDIMGRRDFARFSLRHTYLGRIVSIVKGPSCLFVLIGSWQWPWWLDTGWVLTGGRKRMAEQPGLMSQSLLMRPEETGLVQFAGPGQRRSPWSHRRSIWWRSGLCLRHWCDSKRQSSNCRNRRRRPPVLAVQSSMMCLGKGRVRFPGRRVAVALDVGVYRRLNVGCCCVWLTDGCGIWRAVERWFRTILLWWGRSGAVHRTDVVGREGASVERTTASRSAVEREDVHRDVGLPGRVVESRLLYRHCHDCDSVHWKQRKQGNYFYVHFSPTKMATALQMITSGMRNLPSEDNNGRHLAQI